MKKRLLKTVTVLCLLCGFFVPVRVFADNVYWTSVGNCVNYLTEGPRYTTFNNDSVIGVRWGVKDSSRLYYGWYSSDSSTRYGTEAGSSCEFEATTASNLNIFNDVRFYHASNSTNFGTPTYNSLYNAGSSDNNTEYYGLAFLINKDYSLDKLTYLHSGNSLSSWVGPSDPYTISANNDIYIVGAGSSVYFLSEYENTTLSIIRGSSNKGTTLTGYVTINGKKIYYGTPTSWSYNTSYTYNFKWYNNSLENIYPYAGLVALSSGGSVTPSPSYGDLIDVRFNTDIAGSGTAAVNNIDHIKWNPDNDSNGITFDGSERVEIQAIPGDYTASSRNSLLSLGVTDFDYDSSRVHLLAELPVKNGEYTVSWSHVIQQLNAGSISDFLGIRKSSDTWLKSGWIYQIRLVAGQYISEWQTIYNATSSGVENSLTVENSTEISMELVNVIQSINTMNSSQNENWTINNITINMENSDGQQTTDKPWWAYLLEAIVKAFGDILAFLGNLIGDLMNAITDLFKPAEFTINEYNDFKVEIKQNSGLFGQAIDFTNDLKNTFMGVSYQEPILHWQGISFDGIVFLPAADYNLNDYVEMWGLGNFRQIAYICSDGFIFFSLLLLIIRKLNEVLKK